MTDFSLIKNLFNIQKGKGCSKEEIDRAIEKYGNLPEVLVDYYMELGEEKQLNKTQDFLLLPSELEDFGDYLVFYGENQWVCQWCIAKSDLFLKNPPVYFCENGKEFKKECENLTFFLDSMAHLQALFSFKWSLDQFEEISEEQAVKIKNHFVKKNKRLQYFHRVEFYGNFDDCVIALIDNDGWYFVLYSSDDERHYNEIHDFFKTNVLT